MWKVRLIKLFYYTKFALCVNRIVFCILLSILCDSYMAQDVHFVCI